MDVIEYDVQSMHWLAISSIAMCPMPLAFEWLFLASSSRCNCITKCWNGAASHFRRRASRKWLRNASQKRKLVEHTCTCKNCIPVETNVRESIKPKERESHSIDLDVQHMAVANFESCTTHIFAMLLYSVLQNFGLRWWFSKFHSGQLTLWSMKLKM